ncbi:DVUA0089 family protein [Uliginosibacterium sp. H1]|uniref:DVUA0089 family protein n=1 Tax=Uliginosibacterium sp. H1 TaxID=3114757 RepID=UPI002E173293|nr:DVUA0089 family protein [Uliginosibacterium sp. H1]
MDSRYTRSLWNGLAALFAVVTLSTAQAAPVFEIGDAGQLPGSAQSIAGGVDSIVGNLDNGFDVDLYRLVLGGGLFSATTLPGPACCGLGSDTQLFLFNEAGMGIVANDDEPFGGTQKSFIQALLTPGVYFLAVSVYSMDPFSADGFIFPDYTHCCFQPVDFPTWPGGGQPLAGWSVGPAAEDSGVQPGSYVVSFSPTVGPEDPTPSPVPTPGSIALVGLGLLVLASRYGRHAGARKA